VRMISTIDTPEKDEPTQSGAGTRDEIFVTPGVQVLKKDRLNRGEQARLRRLIQGPVAAMTAEQLSIDLDTGLEHDQRYSPAIGGLHRLVLKSGTRLPELLSCLDSNLPANAPPPVKVLVVEAVARQLGKDWSADTASFVDVSIASARLQDMAQALALEAACRSNSSGAPFAAILLPENEQHSLMCHLTGALFQAFGWQQEVVAHGRATATEFADAVARSDAICIGWSNIRLKPEIERLVSSIRLYQGRRNQPLIAGGIAALDSVDFLVEMGIDCLCDSSYSAVKIAENFNNLEKVNYIAPPIGKRSGDPDIRTDWRSP